MTNMKQLITNNINKIAKIVSCLATCILLTLFCVGCETVTKGVIVDKQYCPAYTTIEYETIGKTIVPQEEHHPEHWTITIRGYLETDDDDSREEYEPYYETYQVSETIYNHYEIGDEFDARKERCESTYWD